jgi:hypothetical protein
MYHNPKFTQRQVAALWSKYDREVWFLDDDEIESARKVLFQHQVDNKDRPCDVKEIPITLWQNSFKVFAFEVTSILS